VTQVVAAVIPSRQRLRSFVCSCH